MRRQALRWWQRLTRRISTFTKKQGSPSRWVPQLEALEDRLTPSTAVPDPAGLLSGLVYVDRDGNNQRDSGEIALPGAKVTLTRTGAGDPISQSVFTNASGVFLFQLVPVGTYQLTREAYAGFIGDATGAGNLGGTIGPTTISDIKVTPGQVGLNFQFAVRGLAPQSLNLQYLVTMNNPGSFFSIASPGKGQVFADSSVDPVSQAAAGARTLSGTVMSGATGLANVLVTLTGIDDTGRAVLQGTTTDMGGNYTFASPKLRPGTYSISVPIAPDGFRNGAATLGSLGGLVLENNVIGGIEVTTADGTGYNFNEVPATTPANPAALAKPTLMLDQIDINHPEQGIRTTAGSSVLSGVTSPGAQVDLVRGSITTTVTANAMTGAFTFGSLALDPGENDFTVRATNSAGVQNEISTFFLVNRAPTGAIADVNALVTDGDRVIDLSGAFTDPDLGNSVVRFNTSSGVVDVQLSDSVKQKTVANFVNYVEDGDYTNTIFHRRATLAKAGGDALQGGGFMLDTSTNPLSFPQVPQDAAVADETQIGNASNANDNNKRGSLALAKGDPNTATSGFFFNLADNTGFNTGGYTVIGQVEAGQDLRVVNSLANASVFSKITVNSAFGDLPLKNYTGTNFPTDATAANFELVNGVSILKQPEFLSYTVNLLSDPPSDGNVVQVQLVHNRLTLNFQGVGTTVVTVHATDLFGATKTVSFNVTVTAAMI